ncbi:hypothetical protein LTR85_009404 [Meristemomyces frigidus]|nr:hypothetical protein LTR85_009404 [Meristemomyces frigidus]
MADTNDVGTTSRTTQGDSSVHETLPSESHVPGITIHIAIEPTMYSVSQSAELPTLNLTVTLHASRPITVFTFPTALNLRLALMRNNFCCDDMTTGEPVWLERTKGPQRPAVRRSKQSQDEKYFLELHPGQPTTVSYPFVLVSGWKHRGEAGPQGRGPELTSVYRGQEYRNFLEPGHTYRFSLAEDQSIDWWRYGTRNEVLEPADAPVSSTIMGCSEPKIVVAALDTAVISIEQ